MTIGGQTHAVTQAGRIPAACSYNISPSAANFGKDEATGTFAVASPVDCGWTASSSAPWLVVTGGQQGAGNGTVTSSITRNREAAERAATITIGGLNFTVRQAGDVPAIDCRSRCSRDRDAVHARWEPDCHGDDPGDMFVDRHRECFVAGNSQRRVRHRARRDPDDLLRQLRRAARGSGHGAVADTDRRPEHSLTQAGCRYAVSTRHDRDRRSRRAGTFDVLQQSDPTDVRRRDAGPLRVDGRVDVPWITITSSMPRSGDNPVAFHRDRQSRSAAPSRKDHGPRQGRRQSPRRGGKPGRKAFDAFLPSNSCLSRM